MTSPQSSPLQPGWGELISIREAARRGIARVRRPIWANSLDHLAIDIFGDTHGPWLHLWSPFNQECNGRDPVDILCIQCDLTTAEFLPYTGPLPDSDEYKADAARYADCLSPPDTAR